MTSPPESQLRRDIVVIGTSVGGLEAMTQVVDGLPGDLPASLFLVQHTYPGFSSPLPELLSRRGKLPATHAIHGEPILQGHIYIAPPDNHLELGPGYLNVVRGPKENGHRPAVDALFRTASKNYGPRVIGVVLTGYMDCGTAGLLSIKARGGLAVIQDPADANVAEMPTHALAHVKADYVCPARDIGPLLVQLVKEEVANVPEPSDLLSTFEGDRQGDAAEIVCPLCQGRLTVGTIQDFPLFRCHVGHTFSMESLLREQTSEIERSLWAAVRALQEGATLLGRVADKSTGKLKERLLERATTQSRQAELINGLLLRGMGTPSS